MSAQRLQFSSEYQNIGPACTQILDLVGKVLDHDKLIELRIALSEALNNVVEHSYEEQVGQPVAVECAVADDHVLITIEDEGKGLPNGWPPDDREAPEVSLANLDDLPEGGMGLRLIESCIDQVKYKRQGALNVLTFKKLK